MGARLFVRTTRAVSLTEAGAALVPAAVRCLDASDECVRTVRGGKAETPMEITLGTRHELGMSWVAPQRRRLLGARPWLGIHLYVSSGPDLLLRVRTHEIDCAITSTPFGDPKLDSFALHREDYVFVGAPRLLRSAPFRRFEDAPRHTVIDISPDLPLFRYLRDAAKGEPGMRFGRGVFLGCIEAIRREVLDGAGVGVLPHYFVRDHLARRRLLRLLPKVQLAHDYFRLVFRAGDPRRAVLESLAKDLRARPLR
jgi:DNA-binding transcriptional LysR family regulator